MDNPVANMVLVPREALAQFVRQYEQEFDPEAIDEARPQWIRDALSAAPSSSLEGEVETRLLDLIGRYWDLAWSEGRSGVSSDTRDGAAQDVLSSITAELRALSADNARLREERDEARDSAHNWHAQCEAIATILELHEPECLGFAGEVRAKFESAEARLSEAVEVLTKISCPTQTEGLLWWQIEARQLLDAQGGGNG